MPPPSDSSDLKGHAALLMRRARLSSGAAFLTEAVLVALFLWGVNPTNLAYSLSVLAQGGFFIALVAAAMLLPILTYVWVGWLLQSVRAGRWAEVRKRLPAVTWLGYASLIGPGYYLHEAIHLLDSPAWTEKTRSGSPATH